MAYKPDTLSHSCRHPGPDERRAKSASVGARPACGTDAEAQRALGRGNLGTPLNDAYHAGGLAACRQRGTKVRLASPGGRDTDVLTAREIKKAVEVCGTPICARQNPQALGNPRAFFMPSFGRKRLGLARAARQAGEGHKRIDSTVSVRALPGGIFMRYSDFENIAARAIATATAEQGLTTMNTIFAKPVVPPMTYNAVDILWNRLEAMQE